ncbi:MAG TPA: 3-deoxy-manno-octulosonate cytidylyltransferase [Nitrospiraceae bacterium]|nr:3-deoxy-manno-octulosonate cytidylyltransferase [Nitrospiraceae bacterium]
MSSSGSRDLNRSSVTVVIPARFASSRFPGKPLVDLAGKPLIQHVYERVQAVPGIERILVATDDVRILEAVKGFGGSALFIDGAFRTGTDRVAAVAERIPGEIFVNLQGDEIIMHPGLMTDLVVPFLASAVGMGTLKRCLTSSAEVHNPGVVKVVTDTNGKALYFSRAPIPHTRDGSPGDISPGLYYIHLGIYIYRRETLMRYAQLSTGHLEDAEKLEQLRALEHGIAITVWETSHPSLRIDTPDDVAHAVTVLQASEHAQPQEKVVS